MGSTMQEEMVSAVNMVADAYEKLKEIDPEHELLKFIEKVRPDKVVFTKDENIGKEFDERFPPNNPNSEAVHTIYSLIKYERATTEAVNNTKGNQ